MGRPTLTKAFWRLQHFANLLLSPFGLRISKVNGALHNPTSSIRSVLMGSSVSGVLHIGAHVGQEAQFYQHFNLPVIWIEGDPDIFQLLRETVAEYENQEAVLGLLGSQDSLVNFHRTSNDGQSSSVLGLNPKHPYGPLKVTSIVKLQQRRLDSLFTEEMIRNYNYWVIDVQGAELEVLRGTGSLFNTCDFLELEVSTFEHYIGQPLFDGVLGFLRQYGFEPVYHPSRYFHGNILFVKSRSQAEATQA